MYGYNGGGNRGYVGDRGGIGNTYDGGKDGGNRGGSYGYSQGRENGGYDQVPPIASRYGGSSGSYPPPNPYSGNYAYGTNAVPPLVSYTNGSSSCPSSYGAAASGYESSNDLGDTQGGRHDGPPNGFGGIGGPQQARVVPVHL
ncbi:hypothetical protein Ancab_011726 [Ancistrocladus abbreviatus]